MKTSGTTATLERTGDSSPKARGSAERIRNGARPTVTPRPIQRSCLSASASSGVAQQVREAHQDGGDVQDEVAEPEALDALQPLREPRRGLGRQQRELRRDVRGRRQVEQRQQAARARGPGEQQEEVEEERGHQGPEEVLREPRRLPPVVARSGRRDDVDGERREAERPEDRGDTRAFAGDREEADDQIEEADERRGRDTSCRIGPRALRGRCRGSRRARSRPGGAGTACARESSRGARGSPRSGRPPRRSGHPRPGPPSPPRPPDRPTRSRAIPLRGAPISPAVEKLSSFRAKETNAIPTVASVTRPRNATRNLLTARFTELRSAIRMPSLRSIDRRVSHLFSMAMNRPKVSQRVLNQDFEYSPKDYWMRLPLAAAKRCVFAGARAHGRAARRVEAERARREAGPRTRPRRRP